MSVRNMARQAGRGMRSLDKEENQIKTQLGKKSLTVTVIKFVWLLGAIVEYIRVLSDINKFVRNSELPKYYIAAVPTNHVQYWIDES